MDYKEIINQSGLKKNHIAKQIGVSPTMLSLFLSSKKNLIPERKRMLHKVLNIK
jgi:predicted transcriptional regulator